MAMSHEAYRGYLIRWSSFSETYWVEKDSMLICFASSLEDAKRKIDEVLG